MTNDTIRTFHALFLPAMHPSGVRPWVPPADIYRLMDGWLLKFELAGVEPENVEGSSVDKCECSPFRVFSPLGSSTTFSELSPWPT